MSPRDPRTRWLCWVAAAMLLANALVLALLVLPARNQRLQQENQLLDLQRRIRTLQREGQSGEVLLSALRQVEEFGRGYPRRAELVGVIGRITKLAQSLAVKVPAVEYQQADVKEAGLTRVTLLMGVEGSYKMIRRFLYELEGMRRHLVIERVSLKDPKGTSELQVQLQLAVYLR
ncbi:MAG: type 4a pilus biogenesis protein PilO [candidate division NC10 bacterium]